MCCVKDDIYDTLLTVPVTGAPGPATLHLKVTLGLSGLETPLVTGTWLTPGHTHAHACTLRVQCLN